MHHIRMACMFAPVQGRELLLVFLILRLSCAEFRFLCVCSLKKKILIASVQVFEDRCTISAVRNKRQDWSVQAFMILHRY